LTAGDRLVSSGLREANEAIEALSLRDESLPNIPLPSGWAKNVKSAVLHVVSLAHHAITCARGWAANSINARVRLAGDNDRLKREAQLLREEIRLKDVRMAKTDPRRQPYYAAAERMARVA